MPSEKAKLLAHLKGTANRNADQWIVWAGEHVKPIVAFGEQANNVKGIAWALRAPLVSSNMYHTIQLLHNCPDDAGWRR